jgi:Zn-dependent protease
VLHILAWFVPFFQGLLVGVLAMLLHESGHLVAALALGVHIKTVGLRWKGLYTIREAGTTAENLLISLAGPCTNLLLMLSWPLSKNFFLANLCYAGFNLLPIEGSDGERVMRLWLQMKAEKRGRDTVPVTETAVAAPPQPIAASQTSDASD